MRTPVRPRPTAPPFFVVHSAPRSHAHLRLLSRHQCPGPAFRPPDERRISGCGSQAARPAQQGHPGRRRGLFWRVGAAPGSRPTTSTPCHRRGEPRRRGLAFVLTLSAAGGRRAPGPTPGFAPKPDDLWSLRLRGAGRPTRAFWFRMQAPAAPRRPLPPPGHPLPAPCRRRTLLRPCWPPMLRHPARRPTLW